MSNPNNSPKDLSSKNVREQPHQREEPSGLSEAALENYEELLRLAERLGDAKRGLNVDQINKITTTARFHKLDEGQSFCVVCMTDFNEEDMVSNLILFPISQSDHLSLQLRILPVCYHEFHVKCIDEWLKVR
jgi:hypothetical protein